jgi:hypothetical protein
MAETHVADVYTIGSRGRKEVPKKMRNKRQNQAFHAVEKGEIKKVFHKIAAFAILSLMGVGLLLELSSDEQGPL